jgi:hypothetical protein
MAITCPQCGAGFDATLFQFGHRVRCRCGVEVYYPGADLRAGHVSTNWQPAAPAVPRPRPPRSRGSHPSNGEGNVQ